MTTVRAVIWSVLLAVTPFCVTSLIAVVVANDVASPSTRGSDLGSRRSATVASIFSSMGCQSVA